MDWGQSRPISLPLTPSTRIILALITRLMQIPKSIPTSQAITITAMEITTPSPAILMAPMVAATFPAIPTFTPQRIAKIPSQAAPTKPATRATII